MAGPAVPASRRWLLLVHLLPATPSNLRVRTWRRLQQLGAIAVKQSVYVLPDSSAAREDFEWLKAEIAGAGGEAMVFASDGVDAWTDDALVEEFRRSRQDAYAELAREVEHALREHSGKRVRGQQRTPARLRQLAAFRQRFADIERVDFFGSAGRDRVATLVAQLEEHATPGVRPTAITKKGDADRSSYHRRLWVTRPRPGVDRMASAWLIRRFIDRRARFAFVIDAAAAARDAVPFDMFGVDFTHHGDRCTFETLCERFGVNDPAVARLGGIVHDLDLKDDRFNAPEAPTIGLLIEGLQFASEEDETLLEKGMSLFEALYRSFSQATQPSGPRAGTRRRASRRTAKSRSI